MKIIPLDAVAVSDVGLYRKNNQDYVHILPQQGIVALADGMGGHQAGEVAAEIAVEIAVDEIYHAQRFSNMDAMQCLLLLASAVDRANASIYALAHSKPELKGMGTTLVVAVFQDDRIFYAHVGDSRLYLFRNGKLNQLTKDHSLIQEALDCGIFPDKDKAKEAGIGENVLTRSLGCCPEINADVNEIKLEKSDLFLLCSDGLSGPLTTYQMEQILNSGEYIKLEKKAKALVKAALDAGSRDNVSIILAQPIID